MSIDVDVLRGDDHGAPGKSVRLIYVIVVTIIMAGCLPAFAQDDISWSYEWKPIKIGGGGFKMGIVIHPVTGDRYIRVDVNGAYRWDEPSGQWKLLIRSDNMPPNDPMLREVVYNGAQSIMVAPSDANRLYLAWGSEYNSPVVGSLYASDNKGKTWARRSSKIDFVRKANGRIGRHYGERLAVDPIDADIAYFGSPADGLWRTLDGGGSWHMIPTEQVPKGIAALETDSNKRSPVGIPLVVFDPTSAVVAGRTQRIWCTAWGEGIYLSHDAGRSWKKVYDRPDVTELNVAGDGTVYATAGHHKDGTTAHVTPDFQTLRYRHSVWRDITPKGCSRNGCLAVSPTDSDFIFVFDGNGTPYRSCDAGQSWESLDIEKVADDVPWLAWTDTAWFALAEVIFDPLDRDRLWCCNGVGMWTAKGLQRGKIVWESVTGGIEDLVAQHVIEAPGGPILCAVMDRSIFVVHDPDQYAERHYPDRRFRGGRDADFCVAQPTHWAAVSTGRVMLSADDGRSWQWAPTQPAGDKIRTSELAVAAGDPEAMAVIADDRKLYWTRDGGRHWRLSSVPGQARGGTTLEADRMAPNTFYCFDGNLGFLASTDGGATWTIRTGAQRFPAGTLNQLAVDFRQAGHLLACWGSAQSGGVIRSRDGGASWERIGGFATAWVCAIGKEREARGPSTLYVRGVRDGQVGIWRSSDDGVTWRRIVDHPRGIYHKGEHLWADWDEFGVVYIALRGNGLAYGRPTVAVESPIVRPQRGAE